MGKERSKRNNRNERKKTIIIITNEKFTIPEMN